MAKKTRTDIEKRYLTQMWLQRKRYFQAQEEFNSIFGTMEDCNRMRKALNEINRLRVALYKERTKMRKVA